MICRNDYLKYLQSSFRSHASKHEFESSINNNIPMIFPSSMGHMEGALKRRFERASIIHNGPKTRIKSTEHNILYVTLVCNMMMINKLIIHFQFKYIGYRLRCCRVELLISIYITFVYKYFAFHHDINTVLCGSMENELIMKAAKVVG